MALDDAGDGVGQVGLGVNVVELAGLDERGDHRPVLGAAIGAGEESVLAGQGDGTDRSFHRVRIDLDGSVLDEAGQALPPGLRVADGLGQLALLADGPQAGLEPGLQGFEQGPGPGLARRATILGGSTADVGLDGVERHDPLQHLAGDRRGAGDGQFIEGSADMGPAEGELHIALLGQRAIAAIAIDLEHASEPGQMLDRLAGLAVGGEDIDGGGRVSPAPGPVVPRIGPELAGLRPASSGVQHRQGGLVGEQLGRGLEGFQQAFVHGPQHEGRPADPVGQGGAIQIDTLAGEDPGLAIERAVVGVLGDEDMGDQGVGGQAPFDQAGWRGRLGHALLAGTAGVLGTAGHQDPELGGDHIQPLAHVLTDLVQGALAAGAGLVLHIHHRLDPGQMRGQATAIGATLPGLRRLLLGRGGLDLGLGLRLDLLDILQGQFELVHGQGLGATAEAVTLEFLDDLPQPFGFRVTLGQGQGVGRALGDQHRRERLGVLRKGAGGGRHRVRLEHNYNDLRRPHARSESPCRTSARSQLAAIGTRVRRA